MNTIYALIDPRTDAVRYIGITVDTLAKRLCKHRYSANAGSIYPVHVWFRKLLKLGLAPSIVAIERTEDRQRECYWIDHYRKQGVRLLNSTTGGDGVPGHRHSEETKAQLRQKTLAMFSDPEFHRRNTDGKRGLPRSEEHRRKLSEALKGRQKPPFTEEHRAKIGQAGTGRVVTDATRAKISGTTKGRAGKPLTEEAKRKISEAQKGKTRGPMSPEQRRKISETLKGRPHSPERCANVAAGKKAKRLHPLHSPSHIDQAETP